MRVLKPTGSIFVNLDDKYGERAGPGHAAGTVGRLASRPDRPRRKGPAETGIRPKSLLGLPARYMIGCIDELGLIVRNDDIWDKVNPTPESARDRCASQHEYVFHLVKQPVYYSAVDEIRRERSTYARAGSARRTAPGQKPRTLADTVNAGGALPSSVWRIASQPLRIPEHIAHHAWGGLG